MEGRGEELEYLNNSAPCGWDDRSVILNEGPAAREMRGCNETQACVSVCECGHSVSVALSQWSSMSDLANVVSLSNQASYREGWYDTRVVCFSFCQKQAV